MSETILSVRELTRQFKGVLAVDHIRMDLKKGGIYGLIGTNGAGKSTVINMISGSISPTEGEILYQGRNVTGTDFKTFAFSAARQYWIMLSQPARSTGNTIWLRRFSLCPGIAGKNADFPKERMKP